MKFWKLASAATALVLSTSVNAATVLDFNDSSDLGVYSIPGMHWDGDGGGHIAINDSNRYSHIFFSAVDSPVTTYLHSFQINGLYSPEDTYFTPGIVEINIYSTDWTIAQPVWTANIDLSTYNTWDNWLTVNVEVADVQGIQITPPNDNPHYNDFYPSFDNIVVTQTSAVPVPAAVWLFGSGLLGLIGMARRKKTA